VSNQTVNKAVDKQDRKCTYNVTLGSVPATIVGVGKPVTNIVSVFNICGSEHHAL